ncbi:MAG: hypothetical protein AAB880_02600 [Patescibacteria group bacterium]
MESKMAEQAELAKLAGSQHHVIQKFHVTTGLGIIPTVALELLALKFKLSTPRQQGAAVRAKNE